MTDSIRPSTRDSLLEAAFGLLSRNPGASLAQVAARAGVGRATLHRHFPSREELIRTLTTLAIAEMDAAVKEACQNVESAADALRRTLEVLIPLGNRHGFLLNESNADDPALTAEFDRLDRETGDLVEACKREGLFDPGVPTPWITEVINALLYTGWESSLRGKTTAQQAVDLAWRTLTRGFGVGHK